MNRALILVDLQNDFMPGEALGVDRGDEVIPVANRLQKSFEWVVATQDWHPPTHSSFASNHPGHEVGEVVRLDAVSQILWPVHCVQRSPGAELVSTLDTSRIVRIFYKGTRPDMDSYSAFFDNGHQQSTGLGDYLRQIGVEDLFLMGLATDYCIKFSALDARELGFNTTVIEDGCRGVELNPGDISIAFEEMKAVGVQILTSNDVEER